MSSRGGSGKMRPPPPPPLLLIDQHPNNHHHSSTAVASSQDTSAVREADATSSSQNTSQQNNSRHRPIQPPPNSRLSSTPTPTPTPTPTLTSASTTDLRKRTSVRRAAPPRAGGGGAEGSKSPGRPESIVVNYTRRPPATPTTTAANNSTRVATSSKPDDQQNNTYNPNLSTAPIITVITSASDSGATAAPQSTTSSLASKTRPPLKARVQNASQMKKGPLEIGLFKIGAGRGPASPRANMASERPKAINNNSSSGGGGGGGGGGGNNRPQMPALSAAAARTGNKTPLMPKLASKASQPPSIATTTPAARRAQRPATTNSISQSTQLDEPSTPIPPFLVNVTPRSGSRQNRVDSTNTTPNGTPNTERFEGVDLKFGSGPVSPRPEHIRRSGSSFSPLLHDLNGHGGREAQHASESKFFHASDVHNARPAATPKQPQAKQATFFYANGNTVDNRPNGAVQSIPAAAQSQDNISSKFMYANGTPEVQSSSLSVPLPQATRPAPVAVKPSTGRLSVGSSASGLHSPRPVSPTKTSSQPGPPSLMSSAIPPSTTTQRGQPSPHLPGSAADKLRRTSSVTSRTRGHHSRSASLVLTDLGASTSALPSKLMSPHYASGPSSPLHMPSTPLTLASIIQAAEELPDQDETLSGDESRSEVQSPTSKSQEKDPVNELVANARRERKVQDLQITNASLEAINRTLERQLRKQTTELRRYKRMSRTGLSLASTAASSRVASEAIFVEEVGLRLANLSEEESEAEPEAEIENEPEEESFSDTDEDIESLTPTQLAERDAKHRIRDEQRLKLDLTKHQQLLVDSQKINQSIKRCLDWTELLIKDGKKALAYNVKISDIQLGGRVLSPLDEPYEQGEPSRLDDDLVDDMLKLGSLITEEPESISDWSPGPHDRDSGIEMPVDGG